MPRKKTMIRRSKAPPEAPQFAAAETAPSPVPRVVRQAGRRFVSEPPPRSRVFNDDTYAALESFFEGRPEKVQFRLAIFRVEAPDTAPGQYLGRIPFPDEILEEVVARQWGPGYYRWQLALPNRFAGGGDLPPDMRDLPLEGWISISEEIAQESGWTGAAASGAASAGVPAAPPIPPDPVQAALAMVKDQQERERIDRRESNNSMVAMMGIVLQGIQAQANQAAELARQQSQFLLGQLQLAEARHKEQRTEKDEMWKQMVDLFRETGGPRGEAADPGLEIVKQLPTILQLLGDFGQRNPAAVAKPAPGAPPPAAPGPAPADGGKAQMEETLRQYVAQVAGKFYETWKASQTPDQIATAVANVGSDEQYDWLLDQEDYMILAVLSKLYQDTVKAKAPPEFIGCAQEVLRLLREDAEAPEAPEAPAPVQVAAPAPAAAAPAPPAAPAAGTSPPVQ